MGDSLYTAKRNGHDSIFDHSLYGGGSQGRSNWDHEFCTPFSLKEAYAKDKLYLIPNIGKKEEIQHYLTAQNKDYMVSDEVIRVKLGSTLEALPLINRMQSMIQGFEVIQGTMDDVFLNVTEKRNKE